MTARREAQLGPPLSHQGMVEFLRAIAWRPVIVERDDELIPG